jgi:hypothetical protein
MAYISKCLLILKTQFDAIKTIKQQQEVVCEIVGNTPYKSQ